jgi:hypothetical protein
LNQPTETRISEFGLQPREVRNQSDRLPAEERLGSSETNAIRGVFDFFEYIPLVWHSESSNIT